MEVDAASGALVYRPDQLRVIGLPLYGAMSLVGLPMSALVSLDRPGASLVGSAMRLDYRKVFPLLGIDGHVQEAWLDDQGLHLRFSQAPGQPSPVFSPPAAAGPSFLWLQSGDLKIFEILITYAQVLLKTETPDQVLTSTCRTTARCWRPAPPRSTRMAPSSCRCRRMPIPCRPARTVGLESAGASVYPRAFVLPR